MPNLGAFKHKNMAINYLTPTTANQITVSKIHLFVTGYKYATGDKFCHLARH